jgi:glucose-6-phosphate 1-epimerase
VGLQFFYGTPRLMGGAGGSCQIGCLRYALRMTLPPSVTLIEEPVGYPILEINHPTAQGRVALNGAHVMEWTPKGADPVLYMSPLAVLEAGQPIRGGIPICWPWFAAHPTDASLPGHGFARLMTWQVEAVTEDLTGVKLTLSLTESEASKAYWPHRFALSLVIQMGARFGIELTVKNTDEVPWSMTGALHTYLTVADVSAVAVLGLDDSYYVESRLSPERIEQSGPVYFDREVDRRYESRDTVRLLDRQGKRTIAVEKSGSGVTVVWNPWIEKSKKLNDLPDDAYPHFVCIEAANAGANTITLEPGAEHVLAQRLKLEK